MNMPWLKWMLVSLLLAASVVQAEDIDLFVGSNPPTAADNPNVIILIDNTSNWTANDQGWEGGVQGQAELDAIITVVNSLAPATADAPFNLGIMLLTEKSGNSENEGAYVRSAVKPMTAVNRKALTDTLIALRDNISAPSEKVNASLGFDQAMFEVFKYFGGYTSVANADSDVAGTPTSPTYFGATRYARKDPNIDPAAFTDSTQVSYNPVISPTSAPSCAGKNYVIVVGNGWVPAEKSGNTYIGETLLNNVGGATSQVYSAGNNDVRFADEMSRFLFQTDVSAAPGKQNVITYALDVYKNKPSAELTALLKSMSQGVGGGAYYKATSAAEIVDGFASIFGAIQSQNSAFASVSLPVSVNTQGTFLNQVFVGMFRPDGSAKPRWFGNLKQYRLAYVDGVLKLVDSQATTPPTSAISTSGSGFINECAVSYWTPAKSSTADGYWSTNTTANCPTYAATSNTPDGNVVEKGGQAYKLREIAPANRNVKTCTVSGTSCSTSLANFDSANTNITHTALGVTEEERSTLINWARGQNTDSEAIGVPAKTAALTSDQLTAKMRPSVHGDIVHSRPVAINYATSVTAPTQVVVYYGGNDGMLRAVNGNRTGGIDIASKAPGQELWSFVAPESYGMFKRLKSNSPTISFPNNLSATAEPKAYGFDGPVTAHRTSSAAWIYATMRRGGRMVYAFDVSNPGSPSLKWRVGCPNQLNDTDCTTGASDIGQTWAVPTVIKSAGFVDGSGASKPMLIMGGGYDTCEDSDSRTSACKSSGKGHVIYLLDADTGAVKQTFDTAGAVVGDITVVKDSAGLATYAYAADLNGNVYRISGAANAPLGSVAPGAWVITPIAELGGSGNADRKFLFGPDVVVEGSTHYVLLGSGDREKPIEFYRNALNVQDYFFMLKDQPTNPTWLSSENATCGANKNVLCMASLYEITSTATPVQSEIDAKKGWALRLTSREKVVTSALTIFGTVYFSTQEPSSALASSCKPNLGESRSYSINFRNAAGVNGDRSVDLVGDGLPPSPVAGLVTLDDGSTVPFCIGCSGASPLEGSEPPVPPTAAQPKARVFWNIEQ